MSYHEHACRLSCLARSPFVRTQNTCVSRQGDTSVGAFVNGESPPGAKFRETWSLSPRRVLVHLTNRSCSRALAEDECEEGCLPAARLPASSPEDLLGLSISSPSRSSSLREVPRHPPRVRFSRENRIISPVRVTASRLLTSRRSSSPSLIGTIPTDPLLLRFRSVSAGRTACGYRYLYHYLYISARPFTHPFFPRSTVR